MTIRNYEVQLLCGYEEVGGVGNFGDGGGAGDEIALFFVNYTVSILCYTYMVFLVEGTVMELEFTFFLIYF